ncbi:glycosyltransferase, partial [Alphaproteobacteria bacterium]|nr:glycosyltransferase [Alphaproteobacteria bacterium]
MKNFHITLTDFRHESRILKETFSIASHNLFKEIIIIAQHSEDLPIKERIDDKRVVYRISLLFKRLPKTFLFQIVKYMEFFFRVIFISLKNKPHTINLHTISLLPLGFVLKVLHNCILIYDTHELETEVEGLVGFRKLLAKILEKSLIKKCDAVCVVNNSIKDWYKKNYDINNIWVVYNTPYLSNRKIRRTGLLRKSINVQSDDYIIYIYQGMLSSGRGIKIMLNAFSKLSIKHNLVILGYGPMEEIVKENAKLHENIHFIPAVSPDEINSYTVDADIGLCLIENTCLSYYLCTPNKLYEYTNCEVVPIVSIFPEMSKFIDIFNCGWKINPDVNSLISLIKKIDNKTLLSMKKNAKKASKKFCW